MRNAVIASPVATQSGYGHHAREIIKQFIDKRGEEWDIKLLSMPWGHTPFTYPIPMDWQRRIIPLPLTAQPDIWVQITVPNEFQAVGKYNIGVTAGTEGDICPVEWIDKINQMQVTIVPSEFTKTVFETTAKNSGKTITTSLQVVPEYFDDKIYDNKNVTTSVSGLDEIKESAAFLSVGHWLQGQIGEDRKNIGGLVHCFFNTYKNKKDAPALILKTSGATYSVTDRIDIENRINQVRDLFPKQKLPNIYLLHGDLTNAEMNVLYNHTKVKAMISFTKSEGFGRPLLEFATTGKPIIAPHYSGPADFLKKDFICALPGGLTPIHPSAQNEFLIADAKWFSVDYDFAGKMMQEVLKNYKTWKDLATRQRYFVNTTFTETAVAKRYEEVLKIIDEGVNKIPKAIELKLPQLKKVDLPTLQKI
jgi:glycosyltransferase involved in cell wall biosynthesis